MANRGSSFDRALAIVTAFEAAGETSAARMLLLTQIQDLIDAADASRAGAIKGVTSMCREGREDATAGIPDRGFTVMDLYQAFTMLSFIREMLGPHLSVFEQFEKEASELQSFGPVLAPELFLRSEREPWRKDILEAVRAARMLAQKIDAARAQIAAAGGGA